MRFIGICGPSNSGKSTICESLLKKHDAGWIEVDHYLKTKEEIPFIGEYRNWELPQNHTFNILFEDLKKLSSGESINHPVYGFKKGKIKGYRQVEPKETIFVEGFYLFSDKNIRDMLDIKIYLDIPEEEIRKRRICTEEDYEWTKKDYLDKVYFPMYKKHGIVQKKYADFVINATPSPEEIEKEIIKILKQSAGATLHR